MTDPSTAEIKGGLVRYYDSDATARDSRGEPGWKDEHRAAFAAFLRSEDKSRLLEIGAGSGYSAAYFAEQGFDVVATDLSPANVERARAKGLDAEVADFYDLAYEDESFDAIWAMSCLVHVPDDDLARVLAELKRVLITGGLLQVGLWEGNDEEGPWGNELGGSPGDERLRRFFSRRSEERVHRLFGGVFSIESFTAFVPQDSDNTYQLLRLRKT
ncbi:MAG: hypothetical protein BMS9Abin07_1059 [Acidimicrobiia bacterium]|nr:MAG: hypothetical protein BMS9Abin07_1059 [Acidimicrobiia bacterium]